MSHPAQLRPRFRSIAAMAVGLALATSLTACGSEDDDKEAAETRTFAADNGSVKIPVDPERVIATGYAVPVLLEADADLVGISEWSRGVNLMTDDDRKDYEDLKKIAGETAASTNYQAIAALNPDLIVLGVPVPALADIDMDKLEDIAPVVVLGPDRPDGWKELGARQTDAAGVSEEYEEAKKDYETRAAELTEKWAGSLNGVKFGHLGGYGEASAGNFQREFAGGWGTNIASDLGVEYYGEVKEPGKGSAAVSEYPALEELPESFAEAEVISYSVEDDGKPGPGVNHVLKSALWKTLPAVRAGKVVPFKFTEAATYRTAQRTLDEIDAALTTVLGDPQ